MARRFGLAVGITIALSLVACSDRAVMPVKKSLADFESQQNAGEWETCRYDISVTENNSYEDVLSVLSSNQLQVCRWEGPTGIVALLSRPAPLDCTLKNRGNVNVRVDRDDAPMNFHRCTQPEIRVPQQWERQNLEMFCFNYETDSGVPALQEEIGGTGSSLFGYFALPVRFVAVQNGNGVLWADFRGYPWATTFIADVKKAAATASWSVDISRCA